MAMTPTQTAPDNDPVVSYNAPGGGAANPEDDPIVGYASPPAPGVGRYAPTEIGVGLARGALVDLPQMAGQALQYAGANNVGGMVRGFGNTMAEKPYLTLNPSQHGAVVNALASGAEQIAPTLAPIGAAIGAAALAPVDLPALAIGAAGAAAGGAVAAGAAGQQTLEKAQAKGVAPDAAQTAARLNAATTFATQFSLGMAGGKVLGTASTALGKLVGTEAAPAAADILSELTGTGSVVGHALKNAAIGGAEAVGLGATQAATSAAIEQHYGVDETSPLDAALQTIPTMLGMTAVLTPFGLASRALGMKAAAQHTAALGDASTAPEIRTQLADQYATAIEQRSGNADAARAFSQNALNAIDQKQPLNVAPELFTPGAILEARPTPALAAPQTRLPGGGFTDENGLYHPAAPQTMFTLPDKSQASIAGVESYLDSLPEGEQREAARAQIFGFEMNPRFAPTGPSATPEAAQANTDSIDAIHQQVVAALQAGGVEPAQPLTRLQFAEARGIGGARSVQEYQQYLADPATQEAVMRENIAKYDQMQAAEANKPKPTVKPSLVSSAPPAAQNPLGDQLAGALRQQQVDRAYAQLEAQRDQERQAIANRTYGSMEADQANAVIAQHDQELEALHGQVNDALRGAGIKPQEVREGEDPAVAMRANADRYQQLLDQQETDTNNAAPPESSAPVQLNTQLRDQMQAALRQREIDRAYQQRGATREADLGVMGNQADAARIAAAAEAGTVQPDANAPKTRENITADLESVNQAQGFDTKAQSMVPFNKRLDSLKLDEMPDHATQIDALSKYLGDKSNKMGDAVRDRMSALLDMWKADQPAPEEPIVTQPETPSGNETISPEATPTLAGTPPVQAETLGENLPTPTPDNAEPSPAVEAIGENIPTPGPDNAEPPEQAEALGENVTQSTQSHAQETANIVDAALAQFNDRLRGGEQLTPLEQERYEDLQSFRQALPEIIAGNTSDAYGQDISNYAREAATKPYTQSYNGVSRPYLSTDPETRNPLMLANTGRLADTLANLQQHGSEQWVKDLAAKLAPLTPVTRLYHLGAAADPKMRGQFDPVTNTVGIFSGGESEHAVLHEAVHAATEAALTATEQQGAPRTQTQAERARGYNALVQIINTARTRAGADTQYGLTNVHEFVAELHSNPAFQQFLRDSKAGPQSLWAKAIGAVKQLLGFKSAAEGNLLERAMQASDVFFHTGDANAAGFPLPENSASNVRFMKSAKDAATVTDEQYSKLSRLVESVTKKPISFDRVNLATYQKMLGWVTKQYIVERLEAIPAMVKSGFAAAARAHYNADEATRITGNAIQEPLAKLVGDVRGMYTKLGGGDKARALDQQLKVIGAEASRGGFDFRMNYAGNVKAGRTLEPANKAYIDDIYRQYATLKATNPGAASALERGMLQNARLHTMTVANLTRNLILASKEAGMAPHIAALDLMDKALAAGRNPDAARFADTAHAALDKRLNAAFADARAKLPQGNVLRDQINEMANLYHAQARDPYFSLGRDGDYFVKVGFKGMDAATQAKLQDIALKHGHVLGNLMGGEDHAFFRVPTIDEATGLYNKLIQAGGAKIDGTQSARGKLADRLDSAYGVSGALRSILSTLHETVEHAGLEGAAAAAVRDNITRQVLSMLPETSSRSAKMQRRGVPGYSADFLADFVRRAGTGAQDLANAYMQPQYTAARDAMDASVDKLARSGNIAAQTRAQMAADEINLRHLNQQKPVENTVVNTINSLGHTFFLAASPAYLLRTMAQPFHRGVPVTGARYGFVNAAKSMAGATSTAMKVIQNTIADGYSASGLRGVLDADASFKNLGLPANEQAFIQELHDRGVLNLGQVRQVQHMQLAGSQRQQDLQRAAAMTAQYAEMGNRLVVALSAFRLAEKANNTAGLAAKSDENTEWAIKVAKQAMDDFDPTNTARNISKNAPITGKITPLLTAFMNYNLQTMQQIARTVHDGMFNQDQSPAGLQRQKEARREFAGLMATTTMISGALGLPFANVAAGLYNTFMNDNNDPRDIRIDAQNFLANTLGHTLGGIVSHGLPHAAGFDSSTFGLENLLPGSEFLASRRLLQDRLQNQSQQLMGPALNAGVGLWEAADKISDGYYVKGIEAMLPSGLKSWYKAAELATRGYTDSKGNPIAMHEASADDPWGNKASAGEIALQGLGFRTARAATRSEAQEFASARQQRLDYQRGLVADQFYKGVTSGDQGTMNNATAALVRYNTANPTQPYTDIQAGIQNRLMGLALARATGTGVNMNVRQLPSLAQQLLFAADRDSAMP